MAIENFFTIQVATKTSEISGVKAVGLGMTSGMPGLDFLNMLFGEITEKKDGFEKALLTMAEDVNAHPLSTREEIMRKKFELHLQKILAAHPEIAEKVKGLPLDVQQKIVQTLALNQKAFDDVLKPLTNGTITAEQIENGAPGLLHALLAAVQERQALILDKKKSATFGIALDSSEELLRPKGNKDEKSSDVLLQLIRHLKNLTPAQLDEIQTKIADLRKKNPDVSIENAILNIISFSPVIITPPPSLDIAIKTVKATVDGSAPLPAMTTGPVGSPIPLQTDSDAKLSAEEDNSEDLWAGFEKPQKGKTSFEDAMKAKMGIHAPILPAANIQVAATSQAATLPFDYSENFYQQFSAHFNGLNINSPANFTSPILQSSAAHAPVPATQAVSIAISKAASHPDIKNITLQLDPSELGKVEIRMSIGKDKTVKAILLAEKPETWAMLQRDAHQLERILQDSGLDASGGLSFELADSGYNFDGQNQRGGGHDSGGTGTGASEEIEIVETSMNWQVDPATGHVRYSILA